MTHALKKLSELKGWIVFIMLIGGGGFTVAMTLVGKASAANVVSLEHRVTTMETHHDDDDRLIDWLVQAMWLKNPELPAPPMRRITR